MESKLSWPAVALLFQQLQQLCRLRALHHHVSPVKSCPMMLYTRQRRSSARWCLNKHARAQCGRVSSKVEFRDFIDALLCSLAQKTGSTSHRSFDLCCTHSLIPLPCEIPSVLHFLMYIPSKLVLTQQPTAGLLLVNHSTQSTAGKGGASCHCEPGGLLAVKKPCLSCPNKALTPTAAAQSARAGTAWAAFSTAKASEAPAASTRAWRAMSTRLRACTGRLRPLDQSCSAARGSNKPC